MTQIDHRQAIFTRTFFQVLASYTRTFFHQETETLNASNFIAYNFFETGNELLRLASSIQPSEGKPATRILSLASRVRNALKQADRPQFVSAFCQSNCGDVSPNVLGAYCIDTGLPCNSDHNTPMVKVNYLTVRDKGMYLQNSKSSLRIKIKQILNCFLIGNLHTQLVGLELATQPFIQLLQEEVIKFEIKLISNLCSLTVTLMSLRVLT